MTRRARLLAEREAWVLVANAETPAAMLPALRALIGQYDSETRLRWHAMSADDDDGDGAQTYTSRGVFAALMVLEIDEEIANAR